MLLYLETLLFYFWESCIAGIVGEISDDGKDYYVWTHKKFDIGFNGKQIVDVNLTSDSKMKLEIGELIKFTYEVKVISLNLHVI